MKPKTPEEVREQAEVFHTGCWYIAELEEPELAAQSESEHDAIEKLVKRWKEYTENDRLGYVPQKVKVDIPELKRTEVPDGL